MRENFFKVDKVKALKIVLFLSLLHSSVFIAFDPQGFSILRIVITLAMLISVGLLIIFSVKIKKHLVPHYFKIVFVLLGIWTIFMVTRSLTSDMEQLITLFGNFLMAWAWITPLGFVFGLQISNWLEVFSYLGIFLLIGIILSFFVMFGGFSIGFGVIQWLKFYPILLLTFYFQNKFNKWVTLISIGVFAFLSIYISQRANAIYLLLSLIFFVIEYLRHKRVSLFFKNLLIFGIIIFLISIIININLIFKVFSNNEEINTDTRTFLFTELFSDLDPFERIIGKGALGTFYSPYFESFNLNPNNEGGDSSTRISIEVGYLEMILKGGYILVILNLLFLLPAAYLGIFRSKNLIGRMSGYYILTFLIMWIFSYWPIYSSEFILLWMAAGTTISKRNLNLTDLQLLSLHKSKLIIHEK